MVKTEIYRVESLGLGESLLSIIRVANDDIPVKQHISLVSVLKAFKKEYHFLLKCKFVISTPCFKVKQPSYMLDYVLYYRHLKSLSILTSQVPNAWQG